MKSRRFTSSSWLPNTLSLKILPCSSACWCGVDLPFLLVNESPRNVDTSTVSDPHITCTKRKRRPIIRDRRKRARISSGLALVTISKSFGFNPNNKSRTAPPTINAEYPASCKASVTFVAQELMLFRIRPCSLC